MNASAKSQSEVPQKTKVKHHKKAKVFGGFISFIYLCRRKG